MHSIDPTETVANITLRMPSAARVFERFGIDFCCRGKLSLSSACAARQLSLGEVIGELRLQAAEPEPTAFQDLAAPALVEHIVERHHRFTRESIARLLPLAQKVLNAHGARHPELSDVQSTLSELAAELLPHMMKEEQVLFPFILQLAEGTAESPPFGTIQNPLRMMLAEHEAVGALLEKLSALSSAYAAPRDGCASYRVLYGG